MSATPAVEHAAWRALRCWALTAMLVGAAAVAGVQGEEAPFAALLAGLGGMSWHVFEEGGGGLDRLLLRVVPPAPQQPMREDGHPARDNATITALAGILIGVAILVAPGWAHVGPIAIGLFAGQSLAFTARAVQLRAWERRHGARLVHLTDRESTWIARAPLPPAGV